MRIALGLVFGFAVLAGPAFAQVMPAATPKGGSATSLSGTLHFPACSSGERTFRIVASGPARLETSVTRAPHAGSVPYDFKSLAFGTWSVRVEETTPPPVPPPGAAPPPDAAPPSSTNLAGCDGPSLGFEPRSRTALVSKAAPRVSGVDFIEVVIALPSSQVPDLGGAFQTTPTPPLERLLSKTPTPASVSAPDGLKLVLPTPTRTPARAGGS